MIYLFLGRREQGKTTLARYIVSQRTPRVIIDPRGLIPVPDGRRVTTADDLHVATDMLINGQLSEIVVTPYGLVQPLFEETMVWCQGFVQANPTQEFGLLVDELRFVDADTPAFDWLLRCTRRDLTTIGMTAHRPTDVPVNVRAITDVWCVFRVAQEHDVKVLAERCSPDAAEATRTLDTHHFVIWDDTTGVMKIHKNPETWRSNLTITPRDNPARSSEKFPDGAETQLFDTKGRLPLE